VILADTNFWLAMSLSKHLFHVSARDWFAKQTGVESVLFCRATQQSFLRLLTTDAATRPYDIPPMTNAGAWKQYEAFIANRRVGWSAEPPAKEIQSLWKEFAARGIASPKLWMDAYLAAFAVAGGHQLVTTDKAFSQFKALTLVLIKQKEKET
jgi:toxin-antitoxin system PIN domain toxin